MVQYISVIPILSSVSQNGFSTSATSGGTIWRGFDGITTGTGANSYRSSIAPVFPEYVTVNFPKSYKVARYKLHLGNANKTYINMATWDFEGLVNGSWVVLHSGTNGEIANTLTFDIEPVEVEAVRIKCKSKHGTNSWGFDEITVYEVVYSNKSLILSNGVYKYHNGTAWVNIGSTVTEQNYIDFGMNDLSLVSQSSWNELTGEIELSYYTDDSSKNEAQLFIETTPFSLADELGSTFSVIEYTDNPTQEQSIVSAETEPFSVYDHISETPEVLVYTELIDDIKVETTTEPFDVYDELGNEVEVLYYTDDTNVNQANLVLEANWSPIDELQGDVEVVTWTSEPQESAQRVLEMTAIPKPQFIKLVNPKRLYGALDEIVAVDISKSYRDEARYLFSNQDGTVWYVWDFKLKSFVAVDVSTHSAILKNGMKWNEMKLISTDNWRSWEHDYMNIGIFLKDNPRDTITSIVDSVSYKDYLPRNSTKVEKANFYILNTTAKIDLNLVGNTVEGVLSDNDLTRVQYRVLLNGSPYYPINGDFTQLSAPPENINITADSNSIVIDDWNTIRVEFRDFFGTTDYWQTNFIGTYSGLMFKDINGDYYSNEIGEVLKQLDFGVIIAGQTTIEHEVILRNQYGYDVKNINLYTNASSLPNGMSIQFSKSLSPFVSESDLLYTDVLSNNDELSFYVRVKTVLNATPNANGNFDIVVRADKA